jgi:hypothetical protein
MPTKCVSHCIKLEKKNCTTQKKCTYINGDKRKYCSLSRKYKMDPPSCNVTRKYKKTDKEDKEDAAKLIQRAFRKSTKKKRVSFSPLKEDVEKEKEEKEVEEVEELSKKGLEKLEEERIEESVKQQNAARKLAKFFNKTGTKRKLHFLNSVCADSGTCITFGRETKKIKEFFDGFTNFHYMKGDSIRIGILSANGFVNLIHYSREGYNSYAVMKSTTGFYSDNLYYEFLVGQFVNTLIPRFPCFLETYGSFMYENQKTWQLCKKNKTTPKSVYEKMTLLKNSTQNFVTSCLQCKYMALLIQSIPDAINLSKLLGVKQFVDNDLLYVLFNVYMPLACLKNQFTHHDLHKGNILLYKTPPGEYIQYNYFTKHANISFKNPYIVKIIDYGRCYFKYGSNDTTAPKLDSSKKIMDEVCKTPQCNTNEDFMKIESADSVEEESLTIKDKQCGKKFGYHWDFVSKNSQTRDLRLLYLFKHDIRAYPKHMSNYFVNLFENLSYKNDQTDISSSGLPKAIHNVEDAYISLFQLLQEPLIAQDNKEMYETMHKLGEFDIYDDGRPMKYTLNK